MKPALWLLIGLGLLFAACHPGEMRWSALMPSAPQHEVGFHHCGEPSGGAITWTLAMSEWEGGLAATPMQPYFPEHPGGLICFPAEGNILFIHSNTACPGDYTCLDLDTWKDFDSQIVPVYFNDNWGNLEPEERWSMALRQIGEALGLQRHEHTSCLPDPFTGLPTVMSIQIGPCPKYQEPLSSDLVGLVCGVYGYADTSTFCNFRPGAQAGATSAGPDSDADGWSDDEDNCPDAPNPTQNNAEIDAFGDVCDSDDDNDVFTDATENYMGTLRADNCNTTSTLNDEADAWPPDFDDSLGVNISDVLSIKPHIGTSSARHDLNASGLINIQDVLAIKPAFGTTCVSTVSQIVDVIEATKQYKNIAVAEADGFVQTTEYIPGRGAYYTRPDRLDAGFIAGEPEGLIYNPGPSGWRLSGVFYLDPVWLEETVPAGFIGSTDTWSIHENFCIAQGLATSEGVSQSACGAAGGVWWDEMGHFLPAWLFRYNPDGVFEELHPSLD